MPACIAIKSTPVAAAEDMKSSSCSTSTGALSPRIAPRRFDAIPASERSSGRFGRSALTAVITRATASAAIAAAPVRFVASNRRPSPRTVRQTVQPMASHVKAPTIHIQRTM